MSKKALSTKASMLMTSAMSLVITAKVGLSNMLLSSCDGFFDSDSQSALSDITNAVNQWWVVPFIAFIVGYAITKDEKKKAICKSAAIGVLVVMIICLLIGDSPDSNFIYSTIQSIKDWLSN